MTDSERRFRGSTPRRSLRERRARRDDKKSQEATMTNETQPDATEWTDDRARQDTLPNEQPRSERETRTDSGASESFADDRNDSDGADAGEQAALGVDQVDDGNQMDLTGETAGDTPEWADDDESERAGMPGFRPGAVIGSRRDAENAEADR